MLQNAGAVLPLQRTLGNQAVVRLLDGSTRGPLVQRVYITEPLSTIGQMRKDFTGYDQLQETIRKYRVAAGKSSDPAILLPMLQEITERMNGLPRQMEATLFNNYTRLSEEITSEKARLSGKEKPREEVITPQTPQAGATPTLSTPTQTQSPAPTPSTSGTTHLIVTGAEISKLLANLLGITVEQLTEERRTGGSLAQIATARGRSAKSVAIDLHRLLHQVVDLRVKGGAATAAEGKQAKDALNLVWVADLMRKGAKPERALPSIGAEPEKATSSGADPEKATSSGAARETPPRAGSKPAGRTRATIVPSSTSGDAPSRAPARTISPPTEAPVSNVTTGTPRGDAESIPRKVELNTTINEPPRTRSAEPWAADPAGYLERELKMTVVNSKTREAEPDVRPGGQSRRKEWTADELAVIAATLSKLGPDAKALEGVGLERVDTLPPIQGRGGPGRIDAGRFSSEIGTQGIAGNRFFLSDRAFQDFKSRHHPPQEMVDTTLHEAGHAVETYAARRASWAHNAAAEKLIKAKADEAVIDQKVADKEKQYEQAAAQYRSKAGTDADKQRATQYSAEYDALIEERTAVENVRKRARQASDAAQAEFERLYDLSKGKSRCLLDFEKFVRSKGIKPTLTEYAAANWPQLPGELYAEAYMVWMANKDQLRAHSQDLYDYFASGKYRG